ncbi:large ribosomal subunit protein mL52 isoform X1 [Armigeres subalbatus]|uniref:large ribosomal subunit protein mL52 isoform X1 n=1 Tax=Armigeres subalbatus TaxID=124917 RepID=UPI002ED1BD95
MKYYLISGHCLTKRFLSRAYSSKTISSKIFHNDFTEIKERNLPRNPNKSGPLTDLPDYTFLDGRVTPLGANQTKRLLQQHELANKIVTMSKEMDFAVERYRTLQANKQKENKQVLDQKLKPKGFLLLS